MRVKLHCDATLSENKSSPVQRRLIRSSCCCCCCLLQISGLLGHAARSEKKSSSVADTEVGLGGTSQWKLCGLDADTTLGVLFEITGNGSALQEQGQVSTEQLVVFCDREQLT
jgi:hypothetical protein